MTFTNASPPHDTLDSTPSRILRTHPMVRPSVRERGSLRLSLAIQTASMIGDAVSIFVAFWLAYQLRYRLELGGHVPPEVWSEFTTYAPPAIGGILMVLVVFPMRGIYSLGTKLSPVDMVPRLFGGVTIVLAGVILLAYFFQFNPSRLIFLYVWGFALVFMIAHRFLWFWIRRWLWRRGIGIDRVLVVGLGQSGRRIMQAMLGNPDLGYRLVGFAADASAGDRVNVATERGMLTCSRLGTVEEIRELVSRYRVDEVVVLDTANDASRIPAILDQCREMVVQFRIVPDLLQLSIDRVDFSDIGGVPTIGIRDASIQGWNAFLKRGIDIVASLVVLTLAALPMGLIAVLIKRDSPGSVFYRQTRVGQFGQSFTMIKFRCMVENADQLWSEMVAQKEEADGRLFKDPNDPRMTRVGKVLRRYSIDELPQFINVLRGEMSIVGPRPPLPKEVAAYDEWHMQRLLLKPGLTGLWQINGRSNLSFDEMVRLDLYYAENWSPGLDTRILLRTIPAVILGRGAY